MKTNVLTLAITLTLGIILAGSVLMPVITDAQKDIGPEITYTNSAIDSTYKLIGVDESLTISLTKNGDTGLWDVVINGDTYTTAADQNLTLLYSDALTLVKNANGTAIEVNYGDGQIIANYADKTITFENGTVTVEVPSNSFTWTGSYNWVYVWDTEGTWINHAGSYSVYVNSINDLIAGGAYTTGDNDCYYSIKNGELSITGEFEKGLSYTITKVDGTTDIYQVSNVVISVGDETFTPFRTLVPVTIHGHATSGAAYSLLGVLPIMVIIGLVLAATAAIVVKRND